MVLVNVLLVSFPRLTWSAPPSPVLLFHPEPWLLGTPISPSPQAASSAGAKTQPKPCGLGSLCFAPGDLAKPFQNLFQHCLAFLSLNRTESRKKGFFGPESFGTFALKIVLTVVIRQALLKSPAFGCLPHSTAFWLGLYLQPFRRVGLLGMIVSDNALHVGSASTWLTLYSCSILLQQGTNIGVTPSTTERLCF